jgi:hypothetical protein
MARVDDRSKQQPLLDFETSASPESDPVAVDEDFITEQLRRPGQLAQPPRTKEQSDPVAVDEDFITEQLRRPGQLAQPPRTKEQGEELRRALRKFSSRAAVIAFFDDWLEEHAAWPKPVDFYQKLRQLCRDARDAKKEYEKPTVSCPKCRDVGCFVDDATGESVRCDCFIGQELDPSLFDAPASLGRSRRDPKGAAKADAKDLAAILMGKRPTRGKGRSRRK